MARRQRIEEPTKLESARLTEFVRNFMPKHRMARWLTILGSHPSKWSKLSMDDLVAAAGTAGPVRLIDIDAELGTPGLSEDPPSVMFLLSSPPYVVRNSVSRLVDAACGDDALIVVTPTLGLVSHHSDGWVVCRMGGH